MPNRHLTEQARLFRHTPTVAEALLWRSLRDRRLDGMKFRRQHPIDRFIADFCCLEHRLIVEVDGDVHTQQQDYDAERTKYLEALGYALIRFNNNEVLHNLTDVLARIRAAILASGSTPLPRTGEGQG